MCYNTFFKLLFAVCCAFHPQKTRPESYGFPFQYVEHCPKTKQTWTTAAKTMNCLKDTKGHFKYLCLPNQNKSALLQFCYYNRKFGLYPKGHCVYLTENGNIQQENCSSFQYGCPEDNYLLHEILKYKDCLSIDKVNMCHNADPSCKNDERQNKENSKEGSKNETRKRISFFISSERKQNKNGYFSEDNSYKVPLTFGVIIPFILVLVLLAVARAKRIGTNRDAGRLMDPENIPLLPINHWDVALYQYGNNLQLRMTHKDTEIEDYIWKKDEKTISKESQHKYDFQMKGCNSSLFIFDVSENDKGKYLFQAADGISRAQVINIEVRTLEIIGISGLPEFEKLEPEDLKGKIIQTRVLHSTEMNDGDSVTFSVVISRKGSTHSLRAPPRQLIDDDDIFVIGLQSILYPYVLSSLSSCSSEIDLSATRSESPQAQVIYTNSALKIHDETLKLIGSQKRNDEAFKTHLTLKAVRSDLFNVLPWRDGDLGGVYVEFRSDEIKFNFLSELLFRCVTTKVLWGMLKSLPICFLREYFSVYSVLQETDKQKFILPSEECKSLIDILYEEQEDEIKRQDSLRFLLEILLYGPYDDAKDFWYRYVRTKNHVCTMGEHVIKVSIEDYDTFVEKLGINILIHPSIEDEDLQEIVHRKLKVPMEIIRWDLQQRKSYVEKYKHKILVKRARLMIVGCAAAGKTTLVERLKNPLNKPKEVEPTVGIEIQNDLFEINEGESDFKMCFSIAVASSLLSTADFAGQTAYYACHQIYLTRRALYVLVLDMTKDFDDKVDHRFNTVSDTMFKNWTYKDFLVFWLRSISTYCDETTPVILVATHKDKCDNELQPFYDKIINALPKEENLIKHLSKIRYFEIAAYPNSGEEIRRLKKCIVEEVVKQTTWREYIPKHWKTFEDSINEQRSRGTNIVQTNTLVSPELKDTYDMLQFYHEIGEILFLNEKGLKDIAILNPSWFSKIVCGILREPKHTSASDQPQSIRTFEFNSPLEKKHFEKKGLLQLSVLRAYFRDNPFAESLLQYMQRLGLMVIDQNVYIPSMNIECPENAHFEMISRGNHTSILNYQFENFLPHFYFFRLIVACMREWVVLEEKQTPLLFQNLVLLRSSRKGHIVVLGCNETFIQLQVYCRFNIQEKVTLEIRSKVERIMSTITKTFHKSQKYSTGYLCRGGCIGKNNSDSLFISEDEVKKLAQQTRRYGESEEACPKHATSSHYVPYEEMLKYWVKTSTSLAGSCYASKT